VTGTAVGTDQVSQHEAMVHAMCAAVDSADADRFASYFAENATYRFGNYEPVAGRAGIAAATAGAVNAVWPVRHRVEQVAEIGSQLFCRFTILVSKPDGVELELPCVTVIELADGLITDYRVHMDITPGLR
jgi:ketosteroid isomerase-like protein